MNAARRATPRLGVLLAALWALVGLAAPSLAEPTPPEGVTITVGGMPFPEGGSQIASCAFDIAVDGLGEGDHTVGVVVEVVAPSVPEGSEQVLVDAAYPTPGPSWSTSIPMDALVGPFERHSNGYHLRLTITIDDAPAGAHTYWLGCDEPQTGNPTRVQFLIEWHRWDGSTVAPPLDAVLPAGWRGPLQLDGTSQKGTAVCTFGDAEDVLTCVYDNPDHDPDEPGLVVPGNPRATYDVAVAGVPSGWAVDPATVGTFVGRETCPRGHDEETPAAEEDRPPCFHTVVIAELQAPTTTSSSTSSSTSTSDLLPASTAAPTTEPTVTGTLPVTGSNVTGPLLWAAALVGLGAAALVGSRRLRAHRR